MSNLLDINQMPLRTLPFFMAVGKHLSFTEAAEELCVTHSAISQNIKKLENFLGVKLFNRQNNKDITLTKTGEKYLIAVNKSLHQLCYATLGIKDEKQHSKLIINAPSTFMTTVIIPKLKNFKTENPDILLKVSSSINRIDFNNQNYDCEIIYESEADLPKDLVCKKLHNDNLILIYPKNKTISLNTLFKTHKAIYVNGEFRKNDWPDFCSCINIPEPSQKQRIYLSSTLQAMELVSHDLGVFVTHELLAHNIIQSKSLAVYHKKCPTNKHYYLSSPPENFNSPSVQKFLKWLKSDCLVGL